MEPLGERATLVQLSTRYCSTCPGTSRLLGGLAAERAGVVHREVDLMVRPEVADRFRVLQTPTTLVLHGSSRICARLGGPRSWRRRPRRPSRRASAS